MSRRKTKRQDYYDDDEEDEDVSPKRRTSSRQTEQSVSPRPPAERQRNNAHALTINQDVWEKFPFKGVPFEVQVLLVNRIDEVTHGHEVAFAMELIYADTQELYGQSR